MDDERAACETRVGTTLRGKWTIDRLLGIGGMAAVYAATHKIGRREAIKILHPEVARSKDLRARFEREAKAVNSFQHPGVVEIRDIDVTDDGAPFLVMELLEGESLADRLQRLGNIETNEMLRLMDELLDVLGAAHARGIIHRDIKLDNLFVETGGRLKVLDFGIARMRDGVKTAMRTRTGATLGTVSYMAPEQVRGISVDHRADLFAVGATMFRLIAKRRIHEARSEPELLVKMATVAAPALASVAPEAPQPLCMVVDRALAFDRERRYPDAATMQQDVRALLRGQAPPYASARLAAGDLPAAGAPQPSPMLAAAASAPGAEAAPQPRAPAASDPWQNASGAAPAAGSEISLPRRSASWDDPTMAAPKPANASPHGPSAPHAPPASLQGSGAHNASAASHGPSAPYAPPAASHGPSAPYAPPASLQGSGVHNASAASHGPSAPYAPPASLQGSGAHNAFASNHGPSAPYAPPASLQGSGAYSAPAASHGPSAPYAPPASLHSSGVHNAPASLHSASMPQSAPAASWPLRRAQPKQLPQRVIVLAIAGGALLLVLVIGLWMALSDDASADAVRHDLVPATSASAGPKKLSPTEGWDGAEGAAPPDTIRSSKPGSAPPATTIIINLPGPSSKKKKPHHD